MFMDGRVNADCGLLNLKAMKCNEYASILSDQTFLKAVSLNESFIDWYSRHHPTRLLDSGPSKHSPPSGLNDEGDLHEDSDFSDLVLKYINQMLMEEDIEEKSCMLQESAALHAAEKSFYDALMVKELPSNSSYLTVPFNSTKGKDATAESVTCFGGSDFSFDVSGSSILPNALISFDSQSRLQPSYSSLSSTSCVVDGFVDSPVSTLSFPDMLSDGQSAVEFQKGMGDASRFLPSDGGILDYMGTGVLLGKDQKDDNNAVVVKVEKKHEISSIPDESRGIGESIQGRDMINNALSELFQMGEFQDTSRIKRKKSCRKQQCPRICLLSTNSDAQDVPVQKDTDLSPSPLPLPLTSNNRRKVKELNQELKVTERVEEGVEEEKGYSDLSGYSQTEVTIIDTSVPSWKFEKMLYRRKNIWKIGDKKGKGLMSGERKKRKKILNENGDGDVEKKKLKLCSSSSKSGDAEEGGLKKKKKKKRLQACNSPNYVEKEEAIIRSKSTQGHEHCKTMVAAYEKKQDNCRLVAKYKIRVFPSRNK